MRNLLFDLWTLILLSIECTRWDRAERHEQGGRP